MQNLRSWYPAGTPIYRAILLKQTGAGFDPGRKDGPESYPAGTEVLAVIDDPERPGMADVQLPSGMLLRKMREDVQLIEEL